MVREYSVNVLIDDAPSLHRTKLHCIKGGPLPVMMATIYSFDHYTESWIEVSSQPSSSSLSSAATDDASPTGLRLHLDQQGRRRRRLTRNRSLPYGLPVRRLSAAGSSQEEYEESESESDRLMASSNEAIDRNLSERLSVPAPRSSPFEETSSNNPEDDDDGNSTALGVLTSEPVFTPQPNAFSHPPQAYTAGHARSLETRASYFPAHRTSPHRRPAHSSPSRTRISHTPYNMIAPSHTADPDAALRASLSTVLSCAAAARGLPKRAHPSTQRATTGTTNEVDPSALRLVPESAISASAAPPPLPPRPSVRHRTSANSLSNSDKGKRKASTSKERNHRDARNKKRRASSPGRETASPPHIAPTLMTWVMSAGVVVLFSAISFSAGYVVGREVGRVEAGTLASREGIVCGKEVGKGLRRLRWGGSSVSVIRV